MLSNPLLKEVRDAKGTPVLKGMSAAVGICHGPVMKACPHPTTGTAPFSAIGETVHVTIAS